MLDHVSIGVRDLARSVELYTAALGELGHRAMITRETTVGFGKTYPELWLNQRPQRVSDADSGNHVCLRAPSMEHVMAFYRVAIERGARGDGPPGMRPEYHAQYYAAFIRDFDDNLVEVVTFVEPAPTDAA